MKRNQLLLLLAGVCLIIIAAASKLTTTWMNDGVYYRTNDMVLDADRNKTNTSEEFVYTKTVITTNKVDPVWFRVGTLITELGFRSDGTVVWRKAD